MKICIVGSGNMTPAMVDYFLDLNYTIVMLNIDLEMAEDVLKSRPGTKAVHWLFDDTGKLDEKVIDQCVSEGDIVISMVPPPVHHVVTEACIRMRKNMLNCSYEDEKVVKLHQKVVEAGIFVLSELGECPGLDHFVTTFLLEDLRSKGYEIERIESFCSGIPSHQANNNPFFYKFNWNPAGMMRSAQHEASYLENGKVVVQPGKKLFSDYVLVDIDGIGTFECYPNRRIDKYIKAFGLEENVSRGLNFKRGLLRHNGYCSTMEKMVALSLFNDQIVGDYGQKTYLEFMNNVVANKKSSISQEQEEEEEEEEVNVKNIKRKVAKYLDIKENSDFIRRLEWLGLFSETKKIDGPVRQSNANVVLGRMLKKLKYSENDSDLVICHISITAEKKSVGVRERHSMTIKSLGEIGGFSAMAKAVGYNAAVTAKLILEKNVDISQVRGCIIPPDWKELAKPVLNEMEKCGFMFQRKCRKI